MNELLERGRAAIPAQYLAAVLMALSGCCFTTMDTFAKLLSDVHGVPVVCIHAAERIAGHAMASGWLIGLSRPRPSTGLHHLLPDVCHHCPRLPVHASYGHRASHPGSA